MTLQFHPVIVILVVIFSDDSMFYAKAAFSKLVHNNYRRDGHPRYSKTRMESIIPVAGTLLSIAHNKKHTKTFW
jgi:hypothetical protein